MSPLHCNCADGSVEAFFLNTSTGTVRFALLPCRRCHAGGSDMGNGRKPDEVPITECEYEARKRGAYREAA